MNDSSEAENENSIPQESSIAGNVSFQNQRRATGSVNASSSKQSVGGIGGSNRGKSTPVVANQRNVQNSVIGNGEDEIRAAAQNSQNQLINVKGSQQNHPAMVGEIHPNARTEMILA